MKLVLKDLNWKMYLIYLDDIIMYGAGFYTVLDRLKMGWTRITEANLKLKPSPFPGTYTCSQSLRSRHGSSQDGSCGELANPNQCEGCTCLLGGGGGIRLIVDFQPLMVISLTASCIRWCMRGYFNVDLSCLGRTIYPNNVWCQATDSILPQVSRKESLRPFILTLSRPVGCLTH